MKFIHKKVLHELEFLKIKIFQTIYQSRLAKSIIESAKNQNLTINNFKINANDVIYINCFTNFSELLTEDKKNPIKNELNQTLAESNVLNNEALNLIINKINEKYQLELFSENINYLKLINYLVEINQINFLSKQIFFNLLKNNFWTSKKLFIFDTIEWIQVSDLKNFIDNHNFIIITPNFRNQLNNVSFLETLCFEKSDGFFEILEKEKLYNYLETKINLLINDQSFSEFLKNKQEDQKIAYEIFKLSQN